MQRLLSIFQLEESPTSIPKFKRTAFEVYNMKRSFINLDQALEYVGDNSKYQQRITYILSFQWIFYAFFVMGMPILFESPTFMCFMGYNQDGDEIYHECPEQQICNQPNILYKIIGPSSITRDFKLYCGQKGLGAFTQSLFFQGQIIGGFVFPILANSFGRKRIILFGVILSGCSIILCGLMQHIELIMPLYFIAGFALSGQETVVYVYITEISATRFRSIASNTLVMTWAVSMLIYPSIQEILVSWRIILIAGIGTPLLMGALVSYLFYVESPRWLASKGKYNDCRSVLRQVSIYNNRIPFEFNFIDEMENYNKDAVQLRAPNYHSSKLLNSVQNLNQNNRQTSMSYFELCRHRKLTKLTIILMIQWFLRYFTYYGILFSVQTLGLSIKYSLMFLSAGEVFGALISAYFKLRMGRIKQLQICLIMITFCSGIFFFWKLSEGCVVVNQECMQEKLLHLSLTFILKFAITFFMTTLNTYTGEVYPTKVRTNGYGVCMTFGSIGSALVPLYVVYSTKTNIAFNPLTNVSIISILCLMLTNYLPETFKQSMHDDIIDDDNQQLQILLKDKKNIKEQEMKTIKSQSADKLWILGREDPNDFE